MSSAYFIIPKTFKGNNLILCPLKTKKFLLRASECAVCGCKATNGTRFYRAPFNGLKTVASPLFSSTVLITG